jgi:hypothetical protein
MSRVADRSRRLVEAAPDHPRRERGPRGGDSYRPGDSHWEADSYRPGGLTVGGRLIATK